MPLYEYRCHTCETTFAEQRPMSRSSEPATCPDGHAEARRVMSVFATGGRASSAVATAPMPSVGLGGGGCCGGACGCG